MPVTVGWITDVLLNVSFCAVTSASFFTSSVARSSVLQGITPLNS